MGAFLSKSMDENFKRQQRFQIEMQQTILERQIAMQNAMRERQMAMQIAWSRDLTYWIGGAIGLCALGAILTRNKKAVVPIIPLTFIGAYQADAGWGSKLKRMRGEADSILGAPEERTRLLEMPGGLPTFEQIETARQAAKNK